MIHLNIHGAASLHTSGARALPSWLTVKEITSHFGAKGKKGYGDFVTEGIKSVIGTPWEDVRGQAAMGSEKFIEAILAVHVRGKGKKEVVRRRELAGIKPEAIMAAVARITG